MHKAIIFDLDGVIVDTERSVWHASSVHLMQSYGIHHDEEKVRPLLMGSKFEDGTKILYDFYKIQDTFENFLAKRRELVRKGFAEQVTLMEGFTDFYTRIKNHKKAIATSMDEIFFVSH